MRWWPRLLLLGAGLIPVGCGGPAPGPPPTADDLSPRVLIIGLDGADWEIVDRLVGEGRLPNLSRLRGEGASGVLMSEEPLLSPIVWTTVATGRGPLEHGIFGFLTRRGGEAVPVSANERRVRALWNILTDHGIGVGVIGWYASWPAEPVGGFLVSDQVASHQVAGTASLPDAGATWPPGLAAVVEEESRTAEAAARERLPALVDGPVVADDEALQTLRGIVSTTELYRRLLARLTAEHRPEVAAVFFEGTDAVGHLFAGHAPPALPGIAADAVARYGATFDRFYDYIDGVVGELTADLDPNETTVVIVSDHGFRVGERRPLVASELEYANRAAHWHRPEGVVLLWGRGVRPGTTIAGATLYDVLPTVLTLVGAPLAETLEGTPLRSVLEPSIPAPPVIVDYEAAGPRQLAEVGEDEWGGQLDKLRALGYVGDEPEAPSAPEGQEGIALNRYNRGRILLAAGRHDEARAEMERLGADFPGSVLGPLGAGFVALELDQPGEAMAAFERAVEASPSMTLAWELLGQSALLAGEPRTAERAGARALELEPASCRGALVVGRTRLLARDVAAAQRSLERATRSCVDPTAQVEALVGLAIVAETRGELEAAARRYAEALALVPDDPWALERAANLEMAQGRPAAAADLLERLVDATGRDPRVLALLGRALAEDRQLERAITALEESLERQPDQDQVRRFLEAVRRARSHQAG